MLTEFSAINLVTLDTFHRSGPSAHHLKQFPSKAPISWDLVTHILKVYISTYCYQVYSEHLGGYKPFIFLIHKVIKQEFSIPCLLTPTMYPHTTGVYSPNKYSYKRWRWVKRLFYFIMEFFIVVFILTWKQVLQSSNSKKKKKDIFIPIWRIWL